MKIGSGAGFKVGVGAGVLLGLSYIENFTEMFLDEYHIESKSGVALSINKPVRYPGNPIITADDLQPWCDEFMGPVPPAIINGGYFAIGWGRALDGTSTVCRFTSIDGISWAWEPITLVSFGGNTSNNICAVESFSLTAVALNLRYWPNNPSGQKYTAVIFNMAGYPTGTWCGANIFGSTDGKTWTGLKTIKTSTTAFYGSAEGSDLVQMADGRWIYYYRTNHINNLRSIAACVSDTTDMAGTWSDAPGYDYGIILPAASNADQQYFISTERIGDIYLHYVSHFHYTATTPEGRHAGYFTLDLYTSRDGLDMTLANATWMDNGAEGTWDDNRLLAHGLFKDSDIWRLYYCGGDSDHGSPNVVELPGIAEIGFRRIGQAASTGTLITDEITTSDALMLNCDSASGGIDVELLDPSDNSVLSGYSQADCDTVSVNEFHKVVKWNGSSQLPVGNFKVKFYLTDAILYSYAICSWQ